jgi:undecaprenyl-diphosphatase
VHAVERLVGVERRVLRELGSIESTVLDTALPRLSRAADHGVLWVVIAGGLAVSGPSGRRAAVRGLAALSLASVTTNVLVKRAAGRRRPPAGLVPAAREPRRVPFTTSFPSGHAASAAAFTTAVALELPATAIPLAPLAFAVAASRVVIGVHYPSDVIAGVALGMAAAGVTRRGLRDDWPAQERRERDRDRD